MLASGVALGIVFGVVACGSLRRIQSLPLRWLPLLLAILVVRLIGVALPLPTAVYVGTLAATSIAAALNSHLPGAFVIMVGSLMNTLVVALNGGMPVSPEAAVLAGARTQLADGLHVLLSEETRASWLGDVIPVGLVRGVFSPGDLALAAGGFWLTFAWVRRR